MDTATILAILITAERLKDPTVKDRESMPLWDCSEHRVVYSDQLEHTLDSPQRVGIAAP